MKRDRARHKILPISRFGLMELTRQRVRRKRILRRAKKTQIIWLKHLYR